MDQKEMKELYKQIESMTYSVVGGFCVDWDEFTEFFQDKHLISQQGGFRAARSGCEPVKEDEVTAAQPEREYICRKCGRQMRAFKPDCCFDWQTVE